jgi:hypothetical protein
MSAEKIPAMKTPKAPTMTDYKSTAQASHGEKLKAMGFAGGGPVTEATFPIRPPTAAPLRSSAPSIGAKRPSVPGFAVGGNVGGREHPVNVTRGAAAEREMAQMEKEAKREKAARAAGNHRRPKGS